MAGCTALITILTFPGSQALQQAILISVAAAACISLTSRT